MGKYFVILALWSVSTFGQNAAAPLTNETIIRLVASGTPAETIINAIRGAGAVNFSFLPGDLDAFQRYRVPDDVVKAMSAKAQGKPIPNYSTPAAVIPAKVVPPQLEPQPTRQPVVSAPPIVAEPQVLTNDSLVRLVKAGMSEDIIVGIVNSQSGRYSLSTDSLIALKQAGVQDKIIAAMVNQNTKSSAAGGAIETLPPPLMPTGNSAIQQSVPSNQIARIFITDSNSWEISGGVAAASNRNGGAASGRIAGGARPQTVEVIKTFGERCPGVTITMDKTQAQYIVLFDHEGGKGYARKDNKIALFRAGGDLLYSGSTRSLGNAVKDACDAIQVGPALGLGLR